jgi:tRNA A37 methylthiotransferase MiaB
VQAPITAAHRDELVGVDLEVLVDDVDAETGGVVGRTHREAPEIDGQVRLRDARARPGALVRARVTGAIGVDVVAEPIEVAG